MENNVDFFPRSTRFSFELNVSKDAALSTDFIALKEETSNLLEQMKNRFKTQVVKATKIETVMMIKNLQREFITFIRRFVQALMVTIKINTTVDVVVATTINNSKAILQNIEITQADFGKEYKEIHQSSTWSIWDDRITDDNSKDGEDSDEIEIEPSQDMLNILEIKNIIENIIVDPWKIYKDCANRNQQQIEVLKIINDEEIEKATEDARMEIDAEAPMDPQTIDQLIEKNTRKVTKNLTAELKNLQNQIKQMQISKKGMRGHGGASELKENARQKYQNSKGSTKSENRLRKTQQKSQKKGQTSKTSIKDADQTPSGSTGNRRKGTRNTNRKSRSRSLRGEKKRN